MYTKICTLCGDEFTTNRKKTITCGKVHTKKCELCGDEFVFTNKTHKFCTKKHIGKCTVCGKKFTITNKSRPAVTCSAKCAMIITKKKSVDFKYEKECVVCGDKFTTLENNQIYCDKQHTKECEVCGKTYNIIANHRPSKTCSSSCASTLSHTESAKKTRKRNSLEKYGVEYPFQAESVIRKIKGSLDNSEFDTRIGSPLFQESLKETYGVDNISKVPEIKAKKITTCQKNYGVDNPAFMQIQPYKEWNNFNEFIKNLKWDCYDLAEYFNVSYDTIRVKARNDNSMDLIKDFYKYSQPELEVKRRLESMGLFENLDFMPQDRTIIKPLELDFYFPKLNIAIEVSPTYTHQYGFFDQFKDDYHYNKYKWSKDNNVDLITIFDWHDLDKIEYILKLKMKHASLLKIEVEECNIKELNALSKVHTEFIIDNDIDLKSKSTYNKHNFIETTYKGEIVSLAIFKSNKNTEEATLDKLIVKNGFLIPDILNQTIIKYISENITIRSIITHSRNSLGKMFNYNSLGFEKVETNKGVLMWHNLKKSKLIKDIDLDDFIKNELLNTNNTDSNNHDIIRREGFLPIYDCGYSKWRLNV